MAEHETLPMVAAEAEEMGSDIQKPELCPMCDASDIKALTLPSLQRLTCETCGWCIQQQAARVETGKHARRDS